MNLFEEQKEILLTEMAKLHARHELSKDMGPDFFEPGMMEYPEQSDGSWDESTGELLLRFESKGTRYDGRTEQIEKVKTGDVIRITRDPENAFNPNNFLLFTEKGKDVGNMPAELCNAVAPLYDAGNLVIESASASFVDPISKRSRHAKQAILFVEMHAKLTAPERDETDAETEAPEMKPADETPEVSVTEPAAAEVKDIEEPADPYALQLDLKENSFSIGGHEIRRDMLLSDIRELKFCENAKEVKDLRDPDCLHVYLRHTAKYAGEDWVVCLLFQDGYFRDLWLEHAKLFQQRSLLKNAASNPRLRKGRAALYSKLKKRLDDLTGSKGEQETDRGNLQYIYYFEGHGTMLVQDNNLPAIVIYIQYYKTDEKTDE